MANPSDKAPGATGEVPTFEAFDKATYDEWRETAVKALKGAPFEKKLLTRTPEGITLEPIYNPSDMEDLPHLGSLPGDFPFVRGTDPRDGAVDGWTVSQEVASGNPRSANATILGELGRGATGINIALDAATRKGLDPDECGVGEVGVDGVSISTVEDLGHTLDGIDVSGLPIRVTCGQEALPFMALFAARTNVAGGDLKKVRGCIGADPLGHLAVTGSLSRPLSKTFESMAQLSMWAEQNAPELRTTVASGAPYSEAGAGAVEELAFAIATGVEYVRGMMENGASAEVAAGSIDFELAVGTSFFMEIAKIRAARMLWAKVVDAFGASSDAQKMSVHVRTSSWNTTATDPWVNILRATTETFSAAVAGVQSIHTAAFDTPVREPDEFSRRVARNIQTVLQEEGNLSRVADPAGGSWYVENLTDQVAREAWKLFREVEAEGGMFASLQAGTPQKKIEKTVAGRVADLNTRKSVLIGTNMYPNLTETKLEPGDSDTESKRQFRAKQVASWRTSDDDSRHSTALAKLTELLEADPSGVVEAAVDAAGAGATIGELYRTISGGARQDVSAGPLSRKRASEQFEELRRRSEDDPAGPLKVFLANMGPIPQHKARADFSRGFFEVAGFDVIGNDGFATPEEAAAAVVSSGAPVAVICSTDPTYPELVPPFVKKLKDEKPEAIVILAGYPKDQIEDHRKAGVDEFIHLRANNYEILVDLLDRTGGRS